MGSIGMFGYETQFINMEDGDSSPDMTQTNFKLGIKNANIRIGVNYVLDPDNRRDKENDKFFFDAGDYKF